MPKLISVSILIAVFALGAGVAISKKPAESAEWSFNATIIEACSCPMFCQCYFNTEPAGHGGGGHGHGDMEHFCRFNNAFQVNKGHHGDTRLDGAKFWVGGDLGGDFAEGKMDWAVLVFDKSTTPAQREAIGAILGHLYPVEWGSFSIGEDANMSWEATKDMAHAKLDGGKGAEVRLERFPGMSDDPVVIENLKYWGAPRNDGFVLMPNKVEAWRMGEKAFEYSGGNGFMITVDLSSKDMS